MINRSSLAFYSIRALNGWAIPKSPHISDSPTSQIFKKSLSAPASPKAMPSLLSIISYNPQMNGINRNSLCLISFLRLSGITLYKKIELDKEKQLPLESNPFIRAKSRAAIQNIKTEWKSLALNPEPTFDKITALYDKQMKSFKMLLNFNRSDFLSPSRLEASGVAIISTYLKEKKGLKGLFVCSTRDAAVNKIKKFIQNKEEDRCSLILCNSGHRRTLLIEKKQGRLHIALMDSSLLLFGEGKFFSTLEDLCKKEDCSVSFYVSNVSRLCSAQGCTVFAIQDSISFLQDPTFFSNIPPPRQKDIKDLENIGFQSSVPFIPITKLPPSFMVGTGSISKLESYKKNFYESSRIVEYLYGQSIGNEPIPRKNKTLNEYIDANSIQIKGKQQNHYITQKRLKYSYFVLEVLKDSSPKEIKQIVDASLLSS
jgi:hypothetical protein